jgi:hypothetical protein
VFEASASDPDLAELAAQMIAQRSRTAGWLVDRLGDVAPLREGCTRDDAVDTVWVLIDPAVFDRLTRHRRWPIERYERWLAASIALLLVGCDIPAP